MSKFLKAIETVRTWIGHDQRSGEERRVKKSRKRVTHRKQTRRKK